MTATELIVKCSKCGMQADASVRTGANGRTLEFVTLPHLWTLQTVHTGEGLGAILKPVCPLHNAATKDAGVNLRVFG